VAAPAEIRIHRATDADVPAITEIYNEAVRTTTGTFDTEPRSIPDRRRWFRSHDARHPIVVGDAGDRVVAWGSLSAWSDRCAYDATGEVSVYVAAASRGSGLGGRVLGALIDIAGEHRYHSLLARVAEGNEASLRLHRRKGFVEVGIMREVGMKFGRRLNVHLLQRMIDVPAAPRAALPSPRTVPRGAGGLREGA
jgi:L-amino acid N-acyltransferase